MGMGNLTWSERKQAERNQRAAVRRAPLRKIIGIWKHPASRRDWVGVYLECGHQGSASYNAQFRCRCLKCLEVSA